MSSESYLNSNKNDNLYKGHIDYSANELKKCKVESRKYNNELKSNPNITTIMKNKTSYEKRHIRKKKKVNNIPYKFISFIKKYINYHKSLLLDHINNINNSMDYSINKMDND